MSRKLAREIAMKATYAQMMGGEGTCEAALSLSEKEMAPGSEDTVFAEDIMAGVARHEAELDAWVEKYAVGWAIGRIPRVDLCILRVALYEMLHREDISHGIAINEAVELAKRFGGDKSSAYINGILGSVSQELGAKAGQ